MFVALVAAVLAGVFSAVRWLDTHSYYVGLQGNELAIYQGRVGGLLWYQPVEVERTGVTTADVTADYLPALRTGVEETSIGAARTYVQNLVAAKASTQTPTVTPPIPTTTTVGPASSTSSSSQPG